MWTKCHSIYDQGRYKGTNVETFLRRKPMGAVGRWAGICKNERSLCRRKFFNIRPKGGPNVKIQLVEVIENKKFVDLTRFPLGKMYGEHVFEETPEGLQITTTMKVNGVLGFFWRRVVAEQIANALPVEMIKQVKYAGTL